MGTQHRALPLSHLALALAVMAVWGTNFVVIKAALAHLPPLTLALLRFTLAFLPLALVLPRPKVAWGNLAAYGVLIGAGQFGLLFTAMRADITPGLASLVVQSQAFFTIFMAMRMTGERIATYQITALLLATSGIATIALHTDGSATPLGLTLTLLAAASWAGGNTVSRAAGSVNMLAYVVWASLFAVPPLLVMALALEGWPAMRAGIASADRWTWAAVIWQSVGNTMFGYGAWGWLLARHPASQVAPLALLVPVFGLGSAALILGESLPWWKLLAFALVMAGLALGILWPRLRKAAP
ncbi:O-acetylserine/cysteine efflux transporter [Novosphingobium kunmingense]|uniref:O-acetylserine/cysteine efflux transporter n=1 Tax=Novosphingobium kunmingense TaxID=1211806 RepID=A0A2N0HJN0_9SPHN|nr:EamA family transporter [Novosphingobium kunmingense]PKB19139.1 O-acetylserine/cysteine efflux transporter [Novosphingobium kunmingense]